MHWYIHLLYPKCDLIFTCDTLQLSSSGIALREARILPESGSTLVISPSLLYQTKVSFDDCHGCPDKGALKLRAEWQRDFDCQAKLICTQLEGNVCGDYAIKASEPDSDPASGYVCYEDVFTTATLGHGQELEMTLIYHNSSLYNVTCYFWCTPTGDLPDLPKDSDIGAANHWDDLVERSVTNCSLDRQTDRV